MNITWNFDATQVEENQFAALQPGKYKVRIAGFEQQKSKSGNDMIKITLDVSGSNSKLFDYLVFNPAQPVITNTKIHSISDSFSVKAGNFESKDWIGKVGAACTKVDAEGYAKVSYYIPKCKQADLVWIEPKNSSKIIAKPLPDIFVDDKDQIPY